MPASRTGRTRRSGFEARLRHRLEKKDERAVSARIVVNFRLTGGPLQPLPEPG